MARASYTSRGIRWIAALGAALLVAGCGTRLNDARIEAAAGVGQTAAGAGADTAAAPAPGAAATNEAAPGLTSDAGTAAATAAQTATAPVAGATPAVTPGAATAATTPGAAAKAGGTTTRAAAGAAATSANGTSSGATAAATPGAPTPTPGAGGAVAGQPASKALIVLGHIGDYSGLIGTLMKGGDVTAQVIARYLNDNGGLDGHPVKVIVGDAGGDPARALSLVRDMVENKGAIAIFGTLMVFSGYGPRDYLEQHKIPIIGGDGTTNVWLQSPMYFTSSANFPGISLGALNGLVDLGTKKIAIVHCLEADQS